MAVLATPPIVATYVWLVVAPIDKVKVLIVAAVAVIVRLPVIVPLETEGVPALYPVAGVTVTV